jgi:hypothetical protein
MPVTMCFRCLYCFDPAPATVEALDQPKMGICRRHAPNNLVLLPENRVVALWAPVRILHDGCGDGEVGITVATPIL